MNDAAERPSREREPEGRLAVALDTADIDTFRGWCRLFGPRVGALKVGLEAFGRWGPRAVEEARRHGRVFLDLKLHDIPHTVARTVTTLRGLGVDLLTVHASGGPAMLRAAREAAGEELGLLAVTLLTHLGGSDLREIGLPGDATERARRWARMAAEAGCRGAVASPREVAELRRDLPRPFLLVTPGIRPAGALPPGDDQRRTASPVEALAAGADLLVVGRPLTGAPEPLAALEALLQEMRGLKVE